MGEMNAVLQNKFPFGDMPGTGIKASTGIKAGTGTKAKRPGSSPGDPNSQRTKFADMLDKLISGNSNSSGIRDSADNAIRKHELSDRYADDPEADKEKEDKNPSDNTAYDAITGLTAAAVSGLPGAVTDALQSGMPADNSINALMDGVWTNSGHDSQQNTSIQSNYGSGSTVQSSAWQNEALSDLSKSASYDETLYGMSADDHRHTGMGSTGNMTPGLNNNPDAMSIDATGTTAAADVGPPQNDENITIGQSENGTSEAYNQLIEQASEMQSQSADIGAGTKNRSQLSATGLFRQPGGSKVAIGKPEISAQTNADTAKAADEAADGRLRKPALDYILSADSRFGLVNNSRLQTDAPDSSARTSMENLAGTIMDQISSKSYLIDGNGRKELTVQLVPDTFGKLSIQLTEDKGLTSARIITDVLHTKELIQSQLSVLKQQLSDLGLQVKEFDVVFRDGGGLQDSGLLQGQAWSSGYYGSSNYGSSHNGSGNNAGYRNAYQNGESRRETGESDYRYSQQVHTGLINCLV